VTATGKSKSTPKRRSSGPTISAKERLARGQRLLQVRVSGETVAALAALPLPGESEPEAVRRAIRSTVAEQIATKSRPPKKSTRPTK
jgi:hypothetical protein